jgi:hypothetical protein
MRPTGLQHFARFGYAARGVVYLLVGGLAFLAALGRGGDTTDSKGALVTLLSQPFGAVLLGVVALGLFCFAAWRIVQSLTDADNLGTKPKALFRRVGFIVSSIINVGLALSAARIALGSVAASGSDDRSTQDWTAYLMSMPFGQWLVAAVGLTIAGVGIAMSVKAWKAGFEDHLSIDAPTRRWVRPVGRAGYFARSLTFLIIGGFLVMAALHARSGEAQGLGGALQTLQSQPYGWILLTVTGAGLFSFGLFQLVVARYRRINTPDVSQMTDALSGKASNLLST